MNDRIKSIVGLVRKSAPLRNLVGAVEGVAFGTGLREAAARGVLSLYYASRFRRDWIWQTNGEQHFSRHTGTIFRLYEGKAGMGVYALSRAFYSSDIVRNGDRILDIGCGDGTFTKSFYSPRAEHVDGIDIEPQAIEYAQRHNSAPNIAYALVDAVAQPFPSPKYDLIIFDGAIGHFAREGCLAVLGKISGALTSDGIFCGSESLGREEGHDHLQYFDTEDDLRALLGTVFPHVITRVQRYPVAGLPNGRVECYWRCAHTRDRLESAGWR